MASDPTHRRGLEALFLGIWRGRQAIADHDLPSQESALPTLKSHIVNTEQTKSSGRPLGCDSASDARYPHLMHRVSARLDRFPARPTESQLKATCIAAIHGPACRGIQTRPIPDIAPDPPIDPSAA